MARKRKKRTKAENQRHHAKKRAYQRYRLELNRKDLDSIVDFIRKGKAVKYDQRSLRTSTYILIYQFRYVRVVYDRKRKTIVSFLPLPDDAVEIYHSNSRNMQSEVLAG